MTASDPRSDRLDCIIVGGGPAGLSAAVNLGRMRHRVLVVDERDRFGWHHVAFNYLGFPDGISGLGLHRLGWRHAAKYGARLLLGHAAFAGRDAAGFRLRIGPLPAWPVSPDPRPPRDPEMDRLFDEVAEGASLEVDARTVILATGVLGHFPEFPGRDACVGQSLFWCTHCSGYESIGRAVAVVGHDEDAVDTALELLAFTDRVALVAGRRDGFAVPAARLEELAGRGVASYAFDVAAWENAGGRMRALVLDDPAHTCLPVEQVYTIRRTRAPNDLARQLGVELDANGQIVVDTEQHTSVPGVFAAGDATSPHDHQLTAAVHEGNQASAAANYYLRRAG